MILERQMSSTKMLQKCTASLLFIALVLWFAPRAKAQAAGATISGVVADSTGAVIPDAVITLKNRLNGDIRTSKSNKDGIFSLVDVPAATYSASIERTGFAQLLINNIQVHPSDHLQLSGVVLRPGSVVQNIEISGGSDGLPSSGDRGITIEASQIQNLAIEGRSAVELLKVLPGVVNQGGDTGETVSFGGGVGSYNVNGGRNDSVGILSDGANVIGLGGNNGAVATPNREFLQELKVQTSNFSAENSDGPTVIEAVTKSGTKDFHGGLYYYVRDYVFNAADWMANETGTPGADNRAQSKYSYPGFEIGGPVLIPGTGFNRNRDKLFFFAGIEWMLQSVELPVRRAMVPTQKMRTGDFTDMPAYGVWPLTNAPCFDMGGGTPARLEYYTYGQAVPDDRCSAVNVIAPQYVDPGGEILMGLYPLPNLNPASNGGYNYVSHLLSDQNRNQQRVKIDYIVNENTKLNAVYNREIESSVQPYGPWDDPLAPNSVVPLPSPVIGDGIAHTVSSSLTDIFGPNLTNDLSGSFSLYDGKNHWGDFSKVSRSSLGYPYNGIYDPSEGLIPELGTFDGAATQMLVTGGWVMGKTKNPELNILQRIFDVNDNLAWSHSKHLVKVGALFERGSYKMPNTLPNQGLVDSAYWAWGGFNNDFANLVSGNTPYFEQSMRNVIGDFSYHSLEWYVQDSWKLAPRFNLDLGARFYHIPWLADQNGNVAIFDPSRYVPGSPVTDWTGIATHNTDPRVPRSGFPSPGLKVAPHVGFAYLLNNRGETVLRGGFGSYYWRDQGNVFTPMISNPPVQVSTELYGQTLSSIDTAPASAGTPYAIYVADPKDNRVPVTYSWSLSLSSKLRALGIGDLAYVGNSSRNLIATNAYNINTVPEGALYGMSAPYDYWAPIEDPLRKWPNYKNIFERSHFATQRYNALQATLRKTTGSVSYLASYTFGKALGIAGGDWGTWSRGVDPFDPRHRSFDVLPYDRTQTFTFAPTVELPALGRRYFEDSRAAKTMLDGWSISSIIVLQSGAPLFSGIPSYEANNNIGLLGSGALANKLSPEYIAGTPDTTVQPVLVCNPNKGLANGQIFNPNCFQAPSPGHNGQYRLPYMRGPWYNSFDLSARKEFKVSERSQLEFRAEAFNVLNHPLWTLQPGDPALQLEYDAYDAPPMNSDSAGRLTTKTGHRTIQLAAKWTF